MKTIIAGPRDYFIYRTVEDAIRLSEFEITEVVSGCASGVDTLGEQWAYHHGIPVMPFPVAKTDWQEKGRAAGPIRNSAMAEYADALIAVWDGKSTGTADMIKKAKTKRLSLYVHKIKESE